MAHRRHTLTTAAARGMAMRSAALLLLLPAGAIALDNGLALTPQMGYNR
jgi:hypothetical protein